jgi:hypothetical protein
MAFQLPDLTILHPNGVFEAYHGVYISAIVVGPGGIVPIVGDWTAALTRTGVRFKDITDGLSNTILVGEKNVPLGTIGIYPWDCSIYDGHNPSCHSRCGGPGFPISTSMRDRAMTFGSYHTGICQFVFCDGSVHVLRNSISEMILGLLAHKSDGQILPNYDD